MIEIRVLVLGIVIVVITSPTISLALNWINWFRNNMSDPDGYKIEVDAECFRN